jgi:dienelactone hydrolase
LTKKLQYLRGKNQVLSEYNHQTNHGYRRWDVDLRVEMVDPQTNKTVTLEFYVPYSAQPLPVIMILPITAGEKYQLERFLAPYFARHGFAAVIVHRETRPECPSAQEMNLFMQQSLLDNQQVMDYLENRAEFNAKHLGVLGTSMGAIKGAMLAGIDSRTKGVRAGTCGMRHRIHSNAKQRWGC